MSGIHEIRVNVKRSGMCLREHSKQRNEMSVSVLGSLLVAAANGHYLEANLAKRVTVEEHAPIKHERGLVHRLVHGAPVDVTELRPFRCNDDGLAVLRGLERSLGDRDLFLDWGPR